MKKLTLKAQRTLNTLIVEMKANNLLPNKRINADFFLGYGASLPELVEGGFVKRDLDSRRKIADCYIVTKKGWEQAQESPVFYVRKPDYFEEYDPNMQFYG